jgi:hypothetical protein
MTEKLFYICGMIGLTIGGFLLHFEEQISFKLVIPTLAVSAFIILLIGRWQKKRGAFK